MLNYQSSSIVINNNSINRFNFKSHTSFVNDTFSNKCVCMNKYNSTSNVAHNTQGSISLNSNYKPITKKVFKGLVNLLIESKKPFHLNVNKSVKIFIDDKIKLIDNFVYTDSATVVNKTVPVVEEINGIKSMKIQCQAGMYFELELDVLKVAECIYSLPEGIKYSKSKIYGTPFSYGEFKSYLTVDKDNVIELIFNINEIQRVL